MQFHHPAEANLEQVKNPTQKNKVIRILIDDDGVATFYQKKTHQLDNVPAEPETWLHYVYEHPYQVAAFTVGAISTIVFTVGLVYLYLDVEKAGQLSFIYDDLNGALAKATQHLELTKNIKIPKKIDAKFIDNYLSFLSNIKENLLPSQVEVSRKVTMFLSQGETISNKARNVIADFHQNILLEKAQHDLEEVKLACSIAKAELDSVMTNIDSPSIITALAIPLGLAGHVCSFAIYYFLGED